MLIEFRFFRFTPDLQWLSAIMLVSALTIVMGGILVNNMFLIKLLELHDFFDLRALAASSSFKFSEFFK